MPRAHLNDLWNNAYKLVSRRGTCFWHDVGNNFAKVLAPQSKFRCYPPGSHAYIRLRSIKQCQFEADRITSVTPKWNGFSQPGSCTHSDFKLYCSSHIQLWQCYNVSAGVLNTSQEECPSDTQRERIIAEVKEDIRNTLLQFETGK